MKRKESFMKNESQLKSSKRGVLLRLAIFMALMISAFIIPSSALADFGYTEDSTNYTIDTGANLVFKVKRSNGDISSLIYNGTDYNGYTNKKFTRRNRSWSVGRNNFTAKQFSNNGQSSLRNIRAILRCTQRRKQHLYVYIYRR